MIRRTPTETVSHPAAITDPAFDLARICVGALDGRHPSAGERALHRIAQESTQGARLFIDGGDPLRELTIIRAPKPADATRP